MPCRPPCSACLAGRAWARLEFSGGIFADVPNEEFERQKDNKSWQVELPQQALRVV